MPRAPKFDDEQILDAALSLSSAGQPSEVSMKGVAALLGAPSGSIYYRFPSRDHLLGALWLRCVKAFQLDFLQALDKVDPIEAALDAACHTVSWSRANPLEARALLLYRRRDFTGQEWPTDLAEQNRRQESAVATSMSSLSQRLKATAGEHERVHLAVIGIPLGAVRPFLSNDESPSDETERLVREASAALLGTFAQRAD